MTASMLLATDGRRLGGHWRTFLIVALGAVALSYHFKALVLMPLWLLCIMASQRQGTTLILRLLTAAGLVALAVQASHYWLERLSCPADTVLAAQHARQSLQLSLGTGILGSVAQMIGNYNLPAYVTLAAPDITPMSRWLPDHIVSKAQQILWCIVMIALWLVAFLFSAIGMVAGNRGRWKAALGDLRVGFAVALFGTASAYCVMQVVRNSYEASFVLPLLAIAYAAALSVPLKAPSPKLSRFATTLAGAMLGSVALVSMLYGPSLVRAAAASGYLAEQPLSVPVFHYASARTAIRRAAAQCGLTPERSHRLLLDDATYFTFMQSRLPDHHLSVLDPKWSGAITDPQAYMKQQKLSGAIVACRFLPPALRAKAHASGNLCCLSRADW